jgi:hypothetical protein
VPDLTSVAEALPLTSNVDFGRTRETWRRIPAAEVTAMPLVDSETTGELISGSSAEVSSATEGSAEEVPGGEVIPFGVKFAVRRPLLFPPEQTLERPENFSVLQDWEGVVETVDAETFTARLRDRTNNESYAAEKAELPISDISDDDLELLRPGAIFYLTIGRLTRPNGRQDRLGRLVFRRLPGWTESTLRRAEQRAERLRRFLAPQN